jgi:hypothetical protein
VSTGRFWTRDTFEGDLQSPASLHKYIYASADPVNRHDPSGNDDLAEFATAFSIAPTVASVSNVLVAGVFSALFRGLPDAVGFGVFVSGGVGHTLSAGGIAGYEVVFAPRLKQEATYVFYGPEGAGSVPLLPSLDGSSPIHGEVGAFVVWYWNFHDLNADVFGFFGPSAGGGFLGVETTLKGGVIALVSGISTDTDLNLYAIAPAFETKLSQNGLSKGAMISEAAATDAAFTGLGVIRGGGLSAAGGIAAAVINGSATALWINRTYGQQ